MILAGGGPGGRRRDGRPGPLPPRLIGLDLDGTVLDLDERLSDRMRDAVAATRAAGIEVVAATGRSAHGTLPVLDRLGCRRGWAVCSNGSVTLRLDPALPRGYEVVESVTFDPAPVLRLLHRTLPAALFAVEEVTTGYRLTAPFPDGELSGPQRLVPFAELLAEPVNRVIVRSPDHSAREFVELAERIGLHGVNYAVGWSAWLDLAPQGVSKATALEPIRAAAAVPPAATLAVGDGRNDLEMFAWSGWAVAMGQADPDVIAAADEVAPPVQDDGCARLLEAVAAAAGATRDARPTPSGLEVRQVEGYLR